jgi:hypothetical protein
MVDVAFIKDAAQSAEVRPNAAQQLKAEIAALADEHSSNAKNCGGNYFNLVHKLRQLSAV